MSIFSRWLDTRNVSITRLASRSSGKDVQENGIAIVSRNSKQSAEIMIFMMNSHGIVHGTLTPQIIKSLHTFIYARNTF